MLTEHEAQRPQELLNSIYNTVPCGILRIRKTQQGFSLVSINPAAVRLLGYAPGQDLTEEWEEGIASTVLPEDRAQLLNAYPLLPNQGERVWSEYRVRWQDGSIHWLQGSNTVVYQNQHEQIIQRMFVDVTESRELQEQLSREREMYRLAMESSNDVMYEYTFATDTLVVYEPRIRENGDSYVDKNVFDFYSWRVENNQIVHPQDIQKVLENICMGKGQAFDCRFFTPQAPKGEGVWYHVTGKVIYQKGVPYRVVGTLHNIHAQKEAFSDNMQRLQMNQAALMAVNSSYLGIYYVDALEDWSYGIPLPGMGGIERYERREHFYRDWHTYIQTQVQEPFGQKLFALTNSKELAKILAAPYDHTSLEYQQKPDGKWLRMDVYLMKRGHNCAHSFVLTFRNVTQERRLELERKQEEAKAKRALEEAYEAARRANAAKSEFFSRMSHDIRTPMNAVVGMTTIAQQHLHNPQKVKECLDKIRLSGNMLLQIINEVLDMAKTEMGGAQLTIAPFLLSDVLNEVSRVLEEEMKSKKLCFTLSLQNVQHNQVEGDRMRVQQILLNLLSNAVKYTPAGGRISLSVNELLCSSSGTGCYQFVVQDNGIGMSEAFLNKLFTPFERAQDARVSGEMGTGLGLSIARNLAHMMNGDIQVQSRLNEGSRFVATLYFKFCTSMPAPAATSPLPNAYERRWRVLLVDDSDLNREIARELLEMQGIAVEEAADGLAALEKFTSAPPQYYDAVFMDMQMPRMDGCQASKAIRELERADAKKVPIIALTANAFADDIFASQQAGMNMHLAKPLDIGQMMEALNQWLLKPGCEE